MSLAFLQPDGVLAHDGLVPVARSPMANDAQRAGARFERRGSWSVATSYGDPEAEVQARAASVVWADASHLGKLEIQGHDLQAIALDACGVPEPPLGRARHSERAWWCPITSRRALVLCEVGDTAGMRARLQCATLDFDGQVVDLSAAFGALRIAGPLARETVTRFCALDPPPATLPVGGWRPGSIARTPGYVLREADDCYLTLFGASLGSHLWTVVADAAGRLGGRPAGADAVRVDDPVGAAAAHS